MMIETTGLRKSFRSRRGRAVKVVEAVRVELVGHHALHDGADGTPVDATQPSDRGLVGPRREPGDEALDVRGMTEGAAPPEGAWARLVRWWKG